MEKSVMMKYQNKDKVKKAIVSGKIKTNHADDSWLQNNQFLSSQTITECKKLRIRS
jgi:hypothetical protein